LNLIAADGVHLRVELEGQDAVAEVDEAGAGVLADDPVPFTRGLQDPQVARLKRSVIARLKPSRYRTIAGTFALQDDRCNLRATRRSLYPSRYRTIAIAFALHDDR
jgi:hypothetical protein